MSYLLMAFTDINNEKTRALIMQKKEWLLKLVAVLKAIHQRLDRLRLVTGWLKF